jgi:hypothetical protein
MDDVAYAKVHEIIDPVDGTYIEHVFACCFGHYDYKYILDKLKYEAAESNKIIETTHGMNGKTFAGIHPHDKLSRRRSKAWRDFLTFNECVICLDFPYAMTIHKSQGSTYEEVYIDTDDLYDNTAHRGDYDMYLRLMYVGMSRASKKVFTT